MLPVMKRPASAAVQDARLAVGVPLLGLTIFIAATPAGNVGFCAFDALDHVAPPCFKIRPLIALGNQPDR